MSVGKLSGTNISKDNRIALILKLYNNLVPLVSTEKFIGIITNSGIIFSDLPVGWSKEIGYELVKNKTLSFSKSILTALEEYDHLCANYLALHFKQFKEYNEVQQEKLSLETISFLLSSSISDSNKRYLLQKTFIETDEQKCFEIGDGKLIKLFLGASGDLSIYDHGIIHLLIRESDASDDAKKLLVKWIEYLSVGEVRNILIYFKHPFNGLGITGKKPRIPIDDTNENEALLVALRRKKIIKQFKSNPSKKTFFVTNE